MTKRCCECKNVKPIEEFAINRSKPDGVASMCKACKKIYNQTYYAATKERHKAGRAASRDRLKEIAQRNVHEYLRCHPCPARSFGFHPLAAFADHGAAGSGEALAIVLRSGNAGSNTAAEHVEAARLALAQLPRRLPIVAACCSMWPSRRPRGRAR